MASSYAAALHSFSRPFRVAYPTRHRQGTTFWLDYVRAHWTKITVAVGIGMLVGFIAGVLSSRAALPFADAVYAASSAPAPTIVVKSSAPTAANQVAQEELTRLREQNKQLETMLADLKKTAPSAHAHRLQSHHRRRTRARA